MIKSIKATSVYKNLKLREALTHAYLIYSIDQAKNNEIALTFAKELVCEHHSVCDGCNACKQFDSSSHPDVYILNQPSIKVDDVKILIDKLSTKPIESDKKVFVILNAEVINETAQNKLLKSLEEPNDGAIFILTTTKTDKLLPTIISRLKKVFVPNFTVEDKNLIATELKSSNIDITSYVNKDFTLTEMLNIVNNSEYLDTITAISNIFNKLNTTADIPSVVNEIDINNKPLFFACLQDMALACLNDEENKFDEHSLAPIKLRFNRPALLKCLPLIEDGYKKLMSNVNFIYILDNMLFNMLKEKFLCK